jgi:hypothetical protein
MTKKDNQEQEINPDCPCPCHYCPRHGKCKECQAYHRKDGSKTSCGK